MGNDYKSAKEAFVADMTGSSIGHINLISLVALASVSLYAALRTRTPLTRRTTFFASWIVLVLPLLLSMTVFAERPIILILLLLTPTALLMLLPYQERGTPLPSSQTNAPVSQHTTPSLRKLVPLPALTTYRAHMLLMTILAILAVDFPIFPRSLAKCETFGVSLMDLGVGSFVFSQGVVSAIPLLKSPAYLTAPLGPKIVNVGRKCFPIIILGLVRVILVKGTEYPEHESEYGTHWNFFLTMAIVPILQVVLHPVLLRLPVAFVGVAIALGQQFALSRLHLQSYVLTAPRTSLISANKEGIVSLTGYLAIHLLGLSAGTIVLPPSPSYFRRQKEGITRTSKRRSSDAGAMKAEDVDLDAPRQTGKTATELCSYSIMWWSFLGLAKVGGGYLGRSEASRRMVNLPYIFWVAAFNTSFLLAYLAILDLAFFPLPRPKKNKPKQTPNETSTYLHSYSPPFDNNNNNNPQRNPIENPPALFTAINKHGLALFLLANLLTGVINLTTPTMYASDGWAMSVLGVYTVVVSALAWYWDAIPFMKFVTIG